MTLRTLIRRNLRFHRRSHLGVVLGAAIGSAALIGALVVGDSVKGSLRERSLERLGSTEFALQSGDRFVSTELVQKLNKSLAAQSRSSLATNRVSSEITTPLVRLNAVITKDDGSMRVNRINVYVGAPPTEYFPEGDVWVGFDNAEDHDPEIQARAKAHKEQIAAQAITNQVTAALFARYFQTNGKGETDNDGVYLNELLAGQLQVKVGDTILLRFQKPASLGGDAVFSSRNDQAISSRLTVVAIVPKRDLGNFSLQSSPATPFNIFISRHTLTNLTGKPVRANIIAAMSNYYDWPAWKKWWGWRLKPLRSILQNFEPKFHSYPVDKLSQTLG